MDLFKNIRKKEKIQKQVDNYFQLMNAYTPVFSSFEGGVYEMELTRSAVHCIATHCSKLKPEVTGANNGPFERALQYRPNPNMNTSQYLYKLATIYMVDNTAFVLPLYENDFKTVCGYYPVKPQNVVAKKYNNGIFFQFRFNGGQVTLEKDSVGIMNQYLYDSDFFGKSNAVLNPTMDLINANNQGIIEGVKNSASIRFIAKLAQSLQPKDIEKERKRLVKDNLSSKNNGGVFLIDSKYEDAKQITSEPFTVNAAQMRQIEENVFTYFGVNKNILQNKFNSEEWSAFYEGKIEPFAIQASLTHTNMTFSENALAYGNSIIFTANRLQYLSPSEKINIVQTLFDRGMMTGNQGCEVFNLPNLGADGDKYYIRKEYIDMQDDKKQNMTEKEDDNNE